MPMFEFEHAKGLSIRGPVIVRPAEEELDTNRTTDIFLPQGVPQNIVEKLTESSADIVSVRLKRREARSNLVVNYSEQRSVRIPRNRDVVIHGMGAALGGGSSKWRLTFRSL